MNIKNTILKIISILYHLLLISIFSLAFYVSIPVFVPTKILTLPKGSVTNTIHHLQDEGIALSKIDTYLLVILGEPKHGNLDIGKGWMNRINFLKKLTSATEAFQVITLIPGETRPIFLEALAKETKLDYDALEISYDKHSNYKESGIMPETYHLPTDIKEDKLIKFLVKLSEKKYKELAEKYLDKYNKKEWLRYLTIASIIQKEAANNQEMPIVASVIYNRLKKGMPLQMDGTLNYGKYSHIKVTAKRIKTDKSKFNTYLNKGLPPYPICAVSTEAITAALKPDTTDYLYFMKNSDGVHDFTHSYKEHLRNIEKARREN
ncbi:MAG: endolytic transglycosylase MltG [Sulfurovaceae bacterium]|nr:endolytic transglycosylase MltG [Sulfurovaceae bacterium]